MQINRRFCPRFSSTSCRSNYIHRSGVLAICLLIGLAPQVYATSRIKDIAHFSGVRNNALTGYGLVMGLKGTGDKQQTLFTNQTLKNMLERFGLNLDNQTIRVQNIAAVIVTADLPAFERPGSKIDVTVSSIGDATSLQGGILVQTPLVGPDGNTYAIAQGSLVLGGFSAGNDATGVTVNHPTVGRIANGGTVERAVVTGLPQVVDTLDLELDRTDFTNVGRVAQAVNDAFGRPIALAVGRQVCSNVAAAGLSEKAGRIHCCRRSCIGGYGFQGEGGCQRANGNRHYRERRNDFTGFDIAWQLEHPD